MAADPIQPSADPDATILNASAELDKLEREYIAVNAASEDDERLSEISDAQTPWVELLTETGAKTIAGIQAKARSLALWEPSLVKATAGDTGRLLTSSILADLLRDVRPPGQLFGRQRRRLRYHRPTPRSSQPVRTCAISGDSATRSRRSISRHSRCSAGCIATR